MSGTTIAVISIVVTSVTAYSTCLIWLVRLEGRVNTNAAVLAEVKDQLRYVVRRLDHFTETGSADDRD